MYDDAIVVPPVRPDDGNVGSPSDHRTPIIFPTKNGQPPTRVKKIVVRRPLPDSGKQIFGKWLATQDWRILNNIEDPTEMTETFQSIVKEKIDDIFPLKTFTISPSDEPWTTFKMKKLKQLRMKEYKKNGKSYNYNNLLKEFKVERKKALNQYINKNVNDAMKNNPNELFQH